jgi:hypothetical protein
LRGLGGIFKNPPESTLLGELDANPKPKSEYWEPNSGSNYVF